VSSSSSTRHFCTLFDSNYASRGIALYRSLERHCSDFRLYVFSMDAMAYRTLSDLALPHLEPIAQSDLEAFDQDLLMVKGSRTPLEYLWTATPSVCRYMLLSDLGVEAVTYIDADVMFFADPSPLLDEANDADVAIVPHGFADRWRHWEHTKGIYNVEFVMFRGSENGCAVLEWWRERCLEWCYARYEDGRLGDQKYLDDWPERFRGVHVLHGPGVGLAPWNVEGRSLQSSDSGVTVDGHPLIFFHYHSLRLFEANALMRSLQRIHPALRAARDGIVWSTMFRRTKCEDELIWEPYIEALREADCLIASVGARRRLERLRPSYAFRSALAELAPLSVRSRASRGRQRLELSTRRRRKSGATSNVGSH
jgi:hypothetical protein